MDMWCALASPEDYQKHYTFWRCSFKIPMPENPPQESISEPQETASETLPEQFSQLALPSSSSILSNTTSAQPYNYDPYQGSSLIQGPQVWVPMYVPIPVKMFMQPQMPMATSAQPMMPMVPPQVPFMPMMQPQFGLPQINIVQRKKNVQSGPNLCKAVRAILFPDQ